MPPNTIPQKAAIRKSSQWGEWTRKIGSKIGVPMKSTAEPIVATVITRAVRVRSPLRPAVSAALAKAKTNNAIARA